MSTIEEMCRRMIILLHETAGIGWQAIQRAVAAQMWQKDHASAEEWQRIGLLPKQAAAASERMKHDLEGSRSPYIRAKRIGAHVITRFDPEYPELLKHTPQPPWVLYALGRLELLTRPSIAVVGTRQPTAYGRHTAVNIAETLSENGMTVVSGMARGIDYWAHTGALNGIGSTVGVLASPIDTCYPPNHYNLYRQIEEEGLLLSETPIGVSLHPGMFPLRNRIIAGMTLGTVVVEAASRSGSLITARDANEMNRNVYAVPGPVSSPKSSGTNELILNGEGKITLGVEQVLEDFAYMHEELALITGRSARRPAVTGTEATLSPEEEQVLGLLREEPRTVDELQGLSSIPFGLLNTVLINLCIKRKIEQQPGSIYIAL
ncbi:DNA-processing protein DprA [Paenibacillus protaetiae]|uniref:DNA-protecting protein DprA n=1 Tax=Paenibacillus protaetiae TaxID=2509456 RepID=A0A4P6ERC6_9BACL|nr:DNA-processing protein DprA [Paenibacillus protaetiae]QAY65590.1 DNA-protecting protein DprA [Paenibacillus protaetiae]